MYFLFLMLVFVIALTLGNHLGDQATLRDCAAKHTAIMKGGGVIDCSVREEVE